MGGCCWVLRVRAGGVDQVGATGTQHLPLPIMVAGQGDRLLQLAAEHADIVGLAGVVPGKRTGVDDPGEAALAERIAFIRAAAGSRLQAIELNLMITAVLSPPAVRNQICPSLVSFLLIYQTPKYYNCQASCTELLQKSLTPCIGTGKSSG